MGFYAHVTATWTPAPPGNVNQKGKFWAGVISIWIIIVTRNESDHWESVGARIQVGRGWHPGEQEVKAGRGRNKNLNGQREPRRVWFHRDQRNMRLKNEHLKISHISRGPKKTRGWTLTWPVDCWWSMGWCPWRESKTEASSRVRCRAPGAEGEEAVLWEVLNEKLDLETR